MASSFCSSSISHASAWTLSRSILQSPYVNCCSSRHFPSLITADAISDADSSISWPSSSPVPAKASPFDPIRALDNRAVKSDFYTTPDVVDQSGLYSLQLPVLDSEPTTLSTVLQDAEQIKELIQTIKQMFGSLDDGDITVSAYDTAWVALVPALDGSAGPQFPLALQWIIDSQLPDGDWGDPQKFLAYDRVSNTLACIVALKKWNLGRANVQRGLEFLWRNMTKLETEDDDHMPVGFEIVFPQLLEDAKELGLNLPYDLAIVKSITMERERKLKKIPMEILHKHPTGLLYSMEGLHKLVDWQKLLKLQEKNGSFLSSPASTACALMHTGDLKCLEYLNSMLNKFNNAVPNVYPVDIFEHLWMIDKLERLGIDRYFKEEMKTSLDYVYRFWSDRGICWGRELSISDVDDSSMGFRILRAHGYDVSTAVFNLFKDKDEFFCVAGQTSQAVTGLFNLHRASHLRFPGEKILEEAESFTRKFLHEKQMNNEVRDKWVIMRDLQGEVKYSLEFPWYASLQRVAARHFLEHYGADDVWIGKTLYRLPLVNSPTYLALAKADFNMCQAIHQRELAQVIRWVEEREFTKINFNSRKATQVFFSAAATMFEPEMASARMVWTQTFVLATLMEEFFDSIGSDKEMQKLQEAVERWDSKVVAGCSEHTRILYLGFSNTVDAISEAAAVQQWDVKYFLRSLWARWISTVLKEKEKVVSGHRPSFKEYVYAKESSIALQPVVLSSIFFVGSNVSEEALANEQYTKMMELAITSTRIVKDIQSTRLKSRQAKCFAIDLYLQENPGAQEQEAMSVLKTIADEAMQGIVKEVLQPSDVPKACKELYLNTLKVLNTLFSNRKVGDSETTEIDRLIEKVLFTPVH